MKRVLLFVLAAFASAAHADSVLLGKTLIGKGDSGARAREAGGEPAQLDRIDGDESTPAMEIWTYRLDGRSITLWLVDGAVVKASEDRGIVTRVDGASGGSRVTGAN
jgi:hypothetical protein